MDLIFIVIVFSILYIVFILPFVCIVVGGIKKILDD